MLTYTDLNCKSTKLQPISTLAKAVIMNSNEDLSNFGNGTENVIRLFHRVVCFELLSCLCDGGIHFFFFFSHVVSLYSPRDSKSICTKTELGWIFRNISFHLVKSSFWLTHTSVLVNIWTTEFETGEKIQLKSYLYNAQLLHQSGSVPFRSPNAPAATCHRVACREWLASNLSQQA